MAQAAAFRWPVGPRTVFYDDDEGVASAPTLRRAVAEGRLRRLAPRLYTADLVSDPADIVVENRWYILGRLLPGAVVVDRSAAEGGKVVDGLLHVATDERQTTLRLPGLEIRVRPNDADVSKSEDLPWPHGLRMSRPARVLVDNLATSKSTGRRRSRTLSLAELEDWLARKSMFWEKSRVSRLREEAIELAGRMAAPDRIHEIDALFERLAGLLPLRPDFGRLLKALLTDQAWDERRVEMFERLVAMLAEHDDPEAPDFLPEGRLSAELPFYESYFSNYIEGTKFTVDEARRIVETQQLPASRPADGHDILGTYRCVVDPVGRKAVSEDPQVLADYLCERHMMILGGRPELCPGKWKQDNNQAGGYSFVAPTLVGGTLHRGFELVAQVPAGFRRALYMMVLVTEVHPFADGNGRVARVMMNAELSAANASRIIIPSVYRKEYLAALRRASISGGDDVSALIRVMSFAWRWTAAMPWEDRAATAGQLEATSALRDPDDLAVGGVQLTLP
ncbi:Fic family protein [Candidatus Poriferisocius sp.]|uniref:Fic family protein n=1 Tax=Candidatus Poriferisocius sp. TaxID=3101276 RepID=UPI003B02811A